MPFEDTDLFLVNRGTDSYKTEYSTLKTNITTGISYNDLEDTPNIPPEFNLEDGSVTNDIIHWAALGSVQTITTTEIGAPGGGNAYTNIPATGGNGSGLTCNVVRRKGTGAHEVYVASPGQDYLAGDTVFLDLGYSADGTTGSTGINCTIEAVNTEDDGWVARPGVNYFISSTQDSVNTGVPQFMLGMQAGGNTQRRRIDGSALAFTIEPIGDKGNVGMGMYGLRDSQSTPVIDFAAGNAASTIGRLDFKRAADTDEDGTLNNLVQRFEATTTGYDFYGVNAAGDGYTKRMTLAYNGVNGVTLGIIDGEQGAGGTKKLELDWKTIAMGGGSAGNQSLRFHSTNGKYNFFRINGSQGYQINAENGTAGYVTPADAAIASNYDAEGEYIGPVRDRVADLIERVNALEANEMIDDATDTSLLQLVASASARLDSIEARLAALEGGA